MKAVKITKGEFSIETPQSLLKFRGDTVVKTYKDTPQNRLSSVGNEQYCLRKFSCCGTPYAPFVTEISNDSYVIERYDFSFGTPKGISERSIRRLLFSCSAEGILRQLVDIEDLLKSKGISHRDINPGNLLFSERDKKLKLIDFYWAKTDDIDPKVPKVLNGVYGINDSNAFSKIKSQILSIDTVVVDQVRTLKKETVSMLGTKYYDGSSKHVGKTYHQIDIPYFKHIKFHRDNSVEFDIIVDNMKTPITGVTDVGCSAGYYLFNFMRKYRLRAAIGYESDPYMLRFLREIKGIFCLDELIIKDTIDPSVRFDKSELIICMNVHMWLEKQFGLNADKIISNLISSSEELFFQTAGLESSGMYTVKSLTSAEVICNYLEKVGKRRVDFIRSTGKHGGKRHLYKIRR